MPLAKWLWLREEHPDRLRRMRTWAGAPDLVAQALTGSVGTDTTFAQRTMAWDARAARWSEDLLALAGLDASRMPTVHAPASRSAGGHDRRARGDRRTRPPGRSLGRRGTGGR
ncbi:FGGY family carbohydrate kinase [Streptomyces sp. M19]